MRSQKEIINKINQILDSGTDPLKIQTNTLIRKLHWNTAKELLNKKHLIDPSIRDKWPQTSCLDKKFLIGEAAELMYQAYDAVIDFDLKKCLIFSNIFIIYTWLLHDDALIREIIAKVNFGYTVDEKYRKFLFKGIFDMICDSMGLRWQIYCRQWEIEEPKTEGESK